MFVGIDIGGTNIKGILTNAAGKIYSFKEIATPDTARQIEAAIVRLIENLATGASISKIDIKAIGVGIAGSINKKKGIILSSTNLKFLQNYPFVKKIEEATGIKVILENDCTIALIGCWWKGNGNKFTNWIMLTLGTGIGGGVIIDNKIYTGSLGNAMEVGHMVIDYKGTPCSCGNQGCWEKYASATALVAIAKSHIAHNQFPHSAIVKKMHTQELSAKIIYEAALHKDKLALCIIQEVASHMGIGIVNLINIFSPDAIFFGGGLSQAYKLLFPTIKQVVKDKAITGLKEHVKFIPIKDQAKIPALGAARLAIDFYASALSLK